MTPDTTFSNSLTRITGGTPVRTGMGMGGRDLMNKKFERIGSLQVFGGSNRDRACLFEDKKVT